MEKTAVFTITQEAKGVSLKSKRYNTYNRINIPEKDLFKAMNELADIFNNVLKLGILFEVG